MKIVFWLARKIRFGEVQGGHSSWRRQTNPLCDSAMVDANAYIWPRHGILWLLVGCFCGIQGIENQNSVKERLVSMHLSQSE